MESATSDFTIIISLGSGNAKKYFVQNNSQTITSPQIVEHEVVFQIHPTDRNFIFEDKTQCPFEDNTVRNFVKQLKNGHHNDVLLTFDKYQFTAKNILCTFIKNLLLHYNEGRVIRDYIFIVDRDEMIPIIQECAAYNHIHPKFIRSSIAIPYNGIEKFINQKNYPFYGICFDFGKTAIRGYITKYTEEGITPEKEIYDESISGDRFTTILLNYILHLYSQSPDLDPEHQAQRVLEGTASKMEYANYFKTTQKVQKGLSTQLDSIFDGNTISASSLRFSSKEFMETQEWKDFTIDIKRIVTDFIKDYKDKNIMCFEFLGMTSCSQLLIETVFKEISDDFGHPQTSCFNLNGAELTGANLLYQNHDTKYILDPEMPKHIEFTEDYDEFIKYNDEYEENNVLINAIYDYKKINKFNMKVKSFIPEKVAVFDDESIDELMDDYTAFSYQQVKDMYQRMSTYYSDQVQEKIIGKLTEFSVDFDGEQIDFAGFNKKLHDNKVNNPTIQEGIKGFIEACFHGFKFAIEIFDFKFLTKWGARFNILYGNYVNHQKFLEESSNGEIPPLSYLDLIKE